MKSNKSIDEPPRIFVSIALLGALVTGSIGGEWGLIGSIIGGGLGAMLVWGILYAYWFLWNEFVTKKYLARKQKKSK